MSREIKTVYGSLGYTSRHLISHVYWNTMFQKSLTFQSDEQNYENDKRNLKIKNVQDVPNTFPSYFLIPFS